MVNGGPESDTALPGEQEPGIAPTEYPVDDIQAFSSIEQKFEHFLDRTIRAGARNGGCRGTWSYDEAGHLWRCSGNPAGSSNPPTFGCVCLVCSFLAFWYNDNEEYQPGFALGMSGVQNAFKESIAKHTAGSRRNVRGYREFIEPESGQTEVQQQSFGNFWGRGFQGYATKVGTYNDLVNGGYLLFDSVRNNVFRFKWNPEKFSKFNVIAFSGSADVQAGVQRNIPGHTYLLVKRGSGGENDPPAERNTPHQIWKLEASNRGTAACNWRQLEFVELIRCTLGHNHSTQCTPLNGDIVSQHPELGEDTFLSPQPMGRTTPNPIRHTCYSKWAIWGLKDLRPNGQAPEVSGYSADQFLNNPARYINSAPAGGTTSPTGEPGPSPPPGPAEPQPAPEPAEPQPVPEPAEPQPAPEPAEPDAGPFIIQSLRFVNGEWDPLAGRFYQWCQYDEVHDVMEFFCIEPTDDDGRIAMARPMDIAHYNIALIVQIPETGEPEEGGAATAPGTSGTGGTEESEGSTTPETAGTEEVTSTPEPPYNRELQDAIAGVHWDVLVGGSEAETFRRDDGRTDKVTVLQRILYTLGYNIGSTRSAPDGVDGGYGGGTEGAVTRFRSNHQNQSTNAQLGQTGIVDHETLKAMLCELVRISAIPYQIIREDRDGTDTLVFNILQSAIETAGLGFDNNLVTRIADTAENIVVRVLQPAEPAGEPRTAARRGARGRGQANMPDIIPCRSETDAVRFAQCIVKIMETGGNYEAVQTVDRGIISYGAYQCTLSGGCLWILLCCWLHHENAEREAPDPYSIIRRRMEDAWRTAVRAGTLHIDPIPDSPSVDDICPGDYWAANRRNGHPIKEFCDNEALKEDEEFLEALRRAAATPSMRLAQDETTERMTYTPALRYAAEDHLTSRVAKAVYYDCINWGLRALTLSREYTFARMDREGISRDAVQTGQMTERDFLQRYLDGQCEYLHRNVTEPGNIRRRPGRIAALRNIVDLELQGSVEGDPAGREGCPESGDATGGDLPGPTE